MSWRAFLVWDDEQLEVEGNFSTEDEAEKAALNALGEWRLGSSMMAWNGDDYDSTEPEIEVWEDDD